MLSTVFVRNNLVDCLLRLEHLDCMHGMLCLSRLPAKIRSPTSNQPAT